MKVRLANGRARRLTTVREMDRGPVRAFNFEVAGLHTYFVGGAGILVHNCPSPGNVPLTSTDVAKIAQKLGLRPTNYTLKGKVVYTDGKRFFVQDVDSHAGGVFKSASSVKGLRSKTTRSGTYDENLNRIGD